MLPSDGLHIRRSRRTLNDPPRRRGTTDGASDETHRRSRRPSDALRRHRWPCLRLFASALAPFLSCFALILLLGRTMIRGRRWRAVHRTNRWTRGGARGGRLRRGFLSGPAGVMSLAGNATRPRAIFADDAEAKADGVVYSTERMPPGFGFRSLESLRSVVSNCDVLNPEVFWDCKFLAEGPGEGGGVGGGGGSVNVTAAEEWARSHPPDCSDHAFVARIDGAFVSDNLVHPDVPGTVFTDDAVYKWQPYVRAEGLPRGHPSFWKYNGGRTNATLHTEYKCLGSVLQAYPDRKGHFPHEVLPRLLFLVEHIPPHCPILMAGGGGAFVRRFVQLFPAEVQQRLVDWKGPGHIYGAESVYVANEGPYCREKHPHNGGMSTFFQPDVVRLVRKYYAPEAAAVNSDETDRHIVIIKRQKGKSRYYTQHVELVSTLRGVFPNKTVAEFTAAGNLTDHIETFASASHVIGPHGAGFANLVFCPPGTLVVEIGWDQNKTMEMDNMYYSLSKALGLEYRLLLGHGGYDSPISLPAEVVVQVVLDQR